ncbi:peptidase M23B [Desulforamulus reducens MI-1]|uniref:Peptidase M23B n=1 Tax=Desulforamulus reducens (strain ATCC BAA-1160 / DSM 100696 / MI-1) TaxID=349161 RepID=A4J2N3_DESRM|nr:peptidoglycan DD-metalloendopeptidase family protein [Desulforamulus reducens]ABO49336.1 peptidase M23B [Desulforamulus reducens MI-1]
MNDLNTSAIKNFKWFALGIGSSGLLLLILLVFFLTGFFMTFLGNFRLHSGFLSGSPTDLAAKEIGEYMPIFLQAQDRFGVSWAVLAAIASTESGFGKSERYILQKGISEAGAVGFMQFMPSTWSGSTNPRANDNPDNPQWDDNPQTIKQYGGYGVDANNDGKADPFDPEDAILSAAKYLKANNFESDPRQALFCYNHATWYVNMILEKAETYASITPMGEGSWPLPPQWNSITSPFGKRTLNGEEEFHPGLDIACPIGTPVFAVIGGEVITADWVSGYGYCVMMKHPDETVTVYGHLSDIKVTMGDNVKQGQVIALSGNTGRSTGPHLHFEVRKANNLCNPMDWLKTPSSNY